MAETIYSISAHQNLYGLIKKVLLNWVFFFFLLERTILFYCKLPFLSCKNVYLLVRQPSSWSCVHGSKETLFWSRWWNSTIPVHGRERWWAYPSEIYFQKLLGTYLNDNCVLLPSFSLTGEQAVESFNISHRCIKYTTHFAW